MTQPEPNLLAKTAYEAYAAHMNATPYAVGRWEDLPSDYRDGYEVMCQEAVRLQNGEAPSA